MSFVFFPLFFIVLYFTIFVFNVLVVLLSYFVVVLLWIEVSLFSCFMVMVVCSHPNAAWYYHHDITL